MITKEEVSIRLGTKIRGLRNSRRLTIEELANDIGLDYSQLSRIERGKINTSVYQIFIIARALNIQLEEIFDGIFHDAFPTNHVPD